MPASMMVVQHCWVLVGICLGGGVWGRSVVVSEAGLPPRPKGGSAVVFLIVVAHVVVVVVVVVVNVRAAQQ